MKKLIALLLVLCMAFSMVACGTPSGNPDDTKGNSNNGELTEKPFAGKTLQLWGLVGEQYENLDKINPAVFLWMIRAAVEEWAEMNDVTIEWVRNYDQAAILSAMNAGDKPDLTFFTALFFPTVANLGIFRPFTTEEKAQLAEIVGETNMNLLGIGETSYSVNYPWTGTNMVYYNKTMLEEYGITTPKEYFEAGEWTWENFAKIAEEATKDVDADGIIDTYGIARNPGLNMLMPAYDEAADGTVSHIFDTDRARQWFNMAYHLDAEAGAVKSGTATVDQTASPRVAMSLSDAEPYNYQHMFKTLPNGDVIECAPAPSMDGTAESAYVNHSVIGMGIPRTCDEVDATMSLITYILKVGMKYMSDYSLGVVESDYEGIQGTSEYSAAWKAKFEEYLKERQAGTANAPGYDPEYMAAMIEWMGKGIQYCGKNYAGLDDWTWLHTAYITPPATAMAELKGSYQGLIDKYNELYINY